MSELALLKPETANRKQAPCPAIHMRFAPCFNLDVGALGLSSIFDLTASKRTIIIINPI